MAEFSKVYSELRRMCQAHTRCSGCPAYANDDLGCEADREVHEFDAAKIEALVMTWAAKNPRKTMLDVFYEHFPKAERLSNGTLRICPYHLDPSWGGLCDDGKNGDCRACWAREVKE